MELTFCPECGAVAEVTWRFSENSTDGPVEHVRLRCLGNHWFLGPASTLLPADPLGAASAPSPHEKENSHE